jgi:hypothetical protein
MDRKRPVELRVRLDEKIRALKLDPGVVVFMAREVAHNMDVASLDQLTAAETAELVITLNTIETLRLLADDNDSTRELVPAG